MEGHSGEVSATEEEKVSQSQRPAVARPGRFDLHEKVGPHQDLGLWHKLLTLSSGLAATGCLLCWALVRAEDTGWRKNSKQFLFSIFQRFCKSHGATEKKRGIIFPIVAGDLKSILYRFAEVEMEEVVKPDFLSMWAEEAWVLCALHGLNFLAGHGGRIHDGPWSAAEKRAVTSLRSSVRRFLQTGGKAAVNVEDIRVDLKEKRVGYSGDELASPEVLTLSQVLPALPPKEHGGAIDILDYVSQGTKDLLLNPELLILPDVGQDLPPLQAKIHCMKPDLLPLCNILTERGICKWFPLSQVATYRGQRILSGLFGVRKPSSLPDGRPILRLIMNLVPSNSIFRTLGGSVSSLPSITSWMSLVVGNNERVECWQSDMVSAFYLFRLPCQWSKYLCFNVTFRGEEIGETPGELFCLCCTVLPMGWGSSVALMQEAAEKLLERSTIGKEGQIKRGKPIPPFLIHCIEQGQTQSKPWWHVYLDNFCASQKIKENPSPKDGNSIHQAAEAAWSEAGILSSAKKRTSERVATEELGAYLDGAVAILSVSGDRFQKLILSTLFIIGKSLLVKKEVQVIAGRWVHALQFRRPGMSAMDAIWEFTSGKRSGPALPFRVRRELMRLCLLAPVLQTNLGAPVQDCITASDSSMKGGAVGIAKTLRSEGIDLLGSIPFATKTSTPTPIMVVSLFNGIGGCFRCYDILGIHPAALIAVEKFAPANRVVSRRWPHAKIIWDVCDIDEELCMKWLLAHPEVEEIHLWGGFPCTDLSSARAGRQGLAGPQSSLFHHIPRVRKLLARVFGNRVTIKEAIENVSSMDRDSCAEISRQLGHYPYHLDCVDAVPMRRPRLCWTGEDLAQAVDGIEIHDERYWRQVTAPADYPQLGQWVTENTIWPGGSDGQVLPTCMKAIPREVPPREPAGISRCDHDTIQRWKADQFRFPPYQYSPQFVFWVGDRWRLANSSERELLLGYGYKHTALCMSASDIKKSRRDYEDLRLSLLGDSFSVHSFVIVAAALCRRFLPRISYKHLCSRMGLAPGYRTCLRLKAPIARKLQYGTASFHNLSSFAVKNLNEFLLSRVNHTGSDIRVSTGDILNPKAYPRQSIEASWWVWEKLFSTRWKTPDHINSLELRSILLALKYQILHLHATDLRVFHVTDSYVCMSIIGKGRSGSKKLRWLLQQLAALLGSWARGVN